MFAYPVIFTFCMSIGLGSDPTPAKYSRKPWHVSAADVVFEKDVPFEQLRVDYLIMDGVIERKNIALFVAPLNASINKELFYVGFSNKFFTYGESGNYNYLHKPGILFTRFAENDSKIAIPPKNGYVLASDHEGPHTGTRLPYLTESGLYTMQLKVEPIKHDKYKSLVKLTIYCHNNKTWTDCGSLHFVDEKPTISRRLSSFIEVTQNWDAKKNKFYERDEDLGTDFPAIRMAVGNWTVDNEPIYPIGITCAYRQDIPQKGRVQTYSNLDAKTQKELDKVFYNAKPILLSISNDEILRNTNTVDVEPNEYDTDDVRHKSYIEFKGYDGKNHLNSKLSPLILLNNEYPKAKFQE